jgi:histidine ammonia-lyase
VSDGRRLTLGAERVGIADVVAASGGATEIVLSDAARGRIARSREIVARYAAGPEPIYGLNTGLGGNLGHRVPVAEVEAFQTQILRGRMIGVGGPLPLPLCRAALFCRIVELASGATGTSPEAIDTLVAMANRDVIPVLPRFGSIGAADMGIVTHMIAVAVGAGEAWMAGERMPGAAALARAGIAPVTLRAKDGLGLVSHGSVGTATAALALHRAGELLAEQAGVAALSFEGFRANPSILDARLQALRPAAGQAEAAALMRRWLDGSWLHGPDGPDKIQDALCFREIAPVLGTALAALRTAVVDLETELNGVTCSPAVLLDEGVMLSSPNFHPSSLTLALEALAIALTHLASGSALRTAKLMTGSLSGLPKYLSPVGGGSAGYVSLQKTAGGLYADLRRHATPTLLDAFAVSDTVEDMAAFALLSARKLQDQLEPLAWLSAIEATVAAQAVDLRGVADRLAPATASLHGAIRDAVPTLREDRPPGADVTAARAVLDGGVMRDHAARLASPQDLSDASR